MGSDIGLSERETAVPMQGPFWRDGPICPACTGQRRSAIERYFTDKSAVCIVAGTQSATVRLIGPFATPLIFKSSG
jgi:hypothetical protein